SPAWNDPALWSGATLAFVLALLGWMPIPLDAAAWHSLWTLERARNTGRHPSTRYAGLDFAIGYGGAVLLAVAFLLLGALTLYDSGVELPDGAVGFATQLIDMYAEHLGQWARGLIAFAALAAMVSTTLTVADAYPRVLRALLELRDPDPAPARHRSRYLIGLAVTASGAWLVIMLFGGRFTLLIDFTTTMSFLAAPVLAWMNLRLLTGPHTPAEARPGGGLRALAWFGLAFLTIFSIVWLWWRVFMG
ncbi:MAG: divalent metal cation transporter, partial [Wenzhouxiangellaceae bacterium]